jgi:hypothetical protein
MIDVEFIDEHILPNSSSSVLCRITQFKTHLLFHIIGAVAVGWESLARGVLYPRRSCVSIEEIQDSGAGANLSPLTHQDLSQLFIPV